MKYKFGIGIVAVIMMIAFYEHLIKGFVLFNTSIPLSLYNFSVCVVLFLFAGGYVKKLEQAVEKHDKEKAKSKAESGQFHLK